MYPLNLLEPFCMHVFWMHLWESFHLYDIKQAHDGGVVAVELSRVIGGAPQLITIGADKTLAIWDTISFKVLCCCL